MRKEAPEAPAGAAEVAVFGPFRLSPAERRLARDGVPVPIGGRALDILIALTDRTGEIVSVRELADRVWPGGAIEGATLRVHIATLRRLLGDGRDGSRYIVNVPRRGYTFVAPIRRAIPGDIAALEAGPPGRGRR